MAVEYRVDLIDDAHVGPGPAANSDPPLTSVLNDAAKDGWKLVSFVARHESGYVTIYSRAAKSAGGKGQTQGKALREATIY